MSFSSPPYDAIAVPGMVVGAVIMLTTGFRGIHPEHSTEPNFEGVFLGFENGRLEPQTYSPD